MKILHLQSTYSLSHGKMKRKNEDDLFPHSPNCSLTIAEHKAAWQHLNKIQNHLQNIFMVTDGCSVITQPDVNQVVRMEEAFEHVHELRCST